MFSIKRYNICLIVMIASALVSDVRLNAQSDEKTGELKDSERSSIMFDFNVKKLRDHKLMKDFDLKEMMKQQNIPENEDFDVTKVNRIQGGIQIPADAASLQPQPGEDLKTNFFFKIEFTDSSAANQMIDSFKTKGSIEHLVDGKIFYSPPDGSAPPNLRMHLASENTVEMGTERYVFLKNRNVVSAKLAENWKQMPNDAAIRLSIDIESNREVVNQMMEQAKAAGGPQAEPFLMLVDDLAALSLGIDFDSEKMLMLRAVGNDSEGTEKLRSGIDGMLGMGKFAGMQGLSQAPIDEDARKVFNEMLKSLKATAEGNTVQVDINKPAGFDETIAKMLGQQ